MTLEEVLTQNPHWPFPWDVGSKDEAWTERLP